MAGSEVGGYDCEFVKEPPEGFPQTECPICHLILRDPQQVSCCGYSYCQVCINRVQGSRCALCNEHYTVFPDKRLKRSLFDLRVQCCHRGDGCKWEGPLRELDNHLNLRLSPEKRFEGCPYSEVECLYCCSAFQRSQCKAHESDDCPKRPYVCQHCSYEATFEDVTGNHLPLCPLSPVTCPTCEQVFQRQELEHHMDQDCPLTLIPCDYHTVGCPEQFTRKDISSHIRHDVDQHTELLNEHMVTHPGEDTSMYVPLLVKSVATYKQLKRKRENERERRGQILTLILLIVLGLLHAVTEMTKQTNNIVQYVPTKKECNTVQFTMTEFEQHMNEEDVWFSPSFYTHNRGYRMCLRIYANGYGEGYSTHVSIFAFLMPGTFDDELQWPFLGKVTVTLRNQIRGKGKHGHTHTINFTDTSDPDVVHRVTSGRRAASGWGLFKFIAHSDLHYNTKSQSQYLKNNSLILKVKVTDTPVHLYP